MGTHRGAASQFLETPTVSGATGPYLAQCSEKLLVAPETSWFRDTAASVSTFSRGQRSWPLVQRASTTPFPTHLLGFTLHSLLNELSQGGGGYFPQYFGHCLSVFRILSSVFHVLSAVCHDLSLTAISDGFSCVKHMFVHYFVVHSLPSKPSCLGALPPRTLYPHVTHIMNDHPFRQQG